MGLTDSPASAAAPRRQAAFTRPAPLAGEGRRREAGFTLLELMVVMALVAALTGLVAPRLWTWVAGARERSDIDALQSALQALPAQTFFGGQTRRIGSAADLGVDLPPSWQLDIPKPILYEANGMSGGGSLSVWDGERRIAAWRVLSPSGKVVPLD